MMKKILFYADGESPDETACAYATTVAADLHASLTIVSVVKPIPHLVIRRGLDLEEIQRLMVEERRRKLEEAIENIRHADIDIAVDVLIGNPATAVIRAVMREGFDMVIKSHAPVDGTHRRFFGSIDDRLMRAAPCVVTILGTDGPKTPRRAIAALDHEPQSETKTALNQAILEVCVQNAAGPPTEFHVVHAWSFYGETLLASGRGRVTSDEYKNIMKEELEERQQWLEGVVSNFRASLEDDVSSRFDPTIELIHGNPAEVIPARVKELDAQFLIVGTVSRSGAAGLIIGNTVEEILQRVECSVVAVKPPGFVSPVLPE